MVMFTDSYTDRLNLFITPRSGEGEFLIYPYRSGTSIWGDCNTGGESPRTYVSIVSAEELEGIIERTLCVCVWVKR